MRSVIPMLIAKIGYIVTSAVTCALGVLLIVNPDFSVTVLGTVFGILLIVFGGIRLVGYFSKDLFRLAFQYDLAFGLLMVLVGILVLVNPGSILNFICITTGLCVLIDSIFKIQIAWESKKFGIRRWWLIMGSAIVSAALSAMLMFRPGESGKLLVILLGITLLAEGILNFSTVITTVKIIKHQVPDSIESTDFEEK